jgi:hypothetical protein
MSQGFINLAVGKIYSIEALIHGQLNSGVPCQLTFLPIVNQVGSGTAPLILFDYVRGDSISRNDSGQFEENIQARGLIDNSLGTTPLKVAFQISVDSGTFVASGSYFVEEVGAAIKQVLS